MLVSGSLHTQAPPIAKAAAIRTFLPVLQSLAQYLIVGNHSAVSGRLDAPLHWQRPEICIESGLKGRAKGPR
jgi:hypothetical protein